MSLVYLGKFPSIFCGLHQRIGLDELLLWMFIILNLKLTVSETSPVVIGCDLCISKEQATSLEFSLGA